MTSRRAVRRQRDHNAAAPHTERVLEAMVEHVVYEIEMLQKTVALIETGSFPVVGGTDVQRVLGNALLEASLIHSRSLDAFFSARSRSQADDVIALDFLPEWPRRTVLNQRQRDRVSKRVAHLTTMRTAGPDPFELAALHEVLGTCAEFLDRLATAHPNRRAWFDRWLR